MECNDPIQFCVKTKQDKELVSKVASFFIAFITLSPIEVDNDSKVKKIAQWVRVDVVLDEIITQIMLNESNSDHWENIQLFVDAGAKTEDLLIDLCRQDRIDHAKRVIRMGGAFGNALLKLRNSIESYVQDNKIKSNDIIEIEKLVAAELKEINEINKIEQELRFSIESLQAKCQNIINKSSVTRVNSKNISMWRAEIKHAEERLVIVLRKTEHLLRRATLMVSDGQAIKAESTFNTQAAQNDQSVLEKLILAVRTRNED